MRSRRYILKTPYRLLNLHALTEVFPGAQFIFTHRKLTEAAPSFYSFMETFFDEYGVVHDTKWKQR